MLVVVLSSLAAGIGSVGGAGLMGLLFGALSALAGWYIWAFLTYFIGTRFLPEPQTEADVGQLLRTIGFSSSPGLLRVAGSRWPDTGLRPALAHHRSDDAWRDLSRVARWEADTARPAHLGK